MISFIQKWPKTSPVVHLFSILSCQPFDVVDFNPEPEPTPCSYAPVLTPFFTTFIDEDSKTANWKISTFPDEIVQITKWMQIFKKTWWHESVYLFFFPIFLPFWNIFEFSRKFLDQDSTRYHKSKTVHDFVFFFIFSSLILAITFLFIKA